MSWLSQLWIELRVRLLALAGRRRLRDRIDEEMRLHLEMRAERLADAGLPGEEARLGPAGGSAIPRSSAKPHWTCGGTAAWTCFCRTFATGRGCSGAIRSSR